jgi:hypothetical protein
MTRGAAAREGQGGLDFFIAHADKDSPAAETLRRALEPHATVFEDSILVAGVDWDIEIAKAADAATITVVLVSDAAETGYYQRAEIARAIARARERPSDHRVIPVYLGGVRLRTLVYGLELKAGVPWSSPGDVTPVVQALVASLNDLRRTVEYGPRQAAGEALAFLLVLDDTARGFPPDEEASLVEPCRQIVNETLVTCARAALDPSAAARDLRHVLHAAGMDVRVLVEELPEHEEALRRWRGMARREASMRSGIAGDIETAVEPLPERFRSRVLDVLREPPVTLTSLSGTARRYLAKLLAGSAPEQTAAFKSFTVAFGESLPPLRSNSREIVAASSLEGTLAKSPAALVLRHSAMDLCRLPPPDPYFIGRDEVVKEIAERIRDLLAQKGSASCALSGHPAVGTSAVAVEVARNVAEDFAGGVLYVDLYGLQPGARRSLTTTVRLISESLALELDSKARGEQDLVRDCVDRLADRKALLLLDNALDAAQVDVLAGAASSCAVMVTSRSRLHERADPGGRFRVEPLARTASVAVLAGFAEGRSLDEREFDRIARLCDDIPLALRLCGARMASRSDLELSTLADLLESEVTRLDYLAVGERAVRSSIQLSYDSLDVDSRRVLRVLGAIPAGRVSGEEVAKCLETPVPRAQLLLNRLVDFSLAEHQPVWTLGERPTPTFRLPELIRLFAAERLEVEELAKTVTAFRRASVAHLLAHSEAQIDRGYGGDTTSELDPGRLHDALRVAHGEGWPELGIRLGSIVKRVYEDQRDTERYLSAGQMLADLQVRSGDAQAGVRALLRDAEQLAGRFEQPAVAIDVLSSARRLATEHALGTLEPEIVFRISLARGDLNEWTEALEAGELAVQMFERVDRLAATVSICINNGRLAHKVGKPQHALGWARKAWDRSPLVDAELKASAASALAAELSVAEPSEAIELWREAARQYDACGWVENAAIMARNAAFAAKQLNDLSTAIALLKGVAERYRARMALNYAATLVELSGLHFAADDGEAAVAALGRAVTALDSEILNHPPAARDDVRLRLAGAQLLEGSSAPPELPDIGPEAAPEFVQLHDLLTTFKRSAVRRRSVRAKIERLIGAWPSWARGEHEFWLHHELAEEREARGALDAGPTRSPA